VNGMEALRAVISRIDPVIDSLQRTAVELIAGPGGAFLLAAAVIGVFVLAIETLLLSVRAFRGYRRRRTPSPTVAGRARGLAKLGARPAEIARAVGLSRDALALVAPAELSRAAGEVTRERIGGRA
jgi:hypothetical protein